MTRATEQRKRRRARARPPAIDAVLAMAAPAPPEQPNPLRRLPAATLTGRREDDDPGAKGIRAMQKATYEKERIAFDPFDAIQKPYEARHHEAEGRAHLTPPPGDVVAAVNPHGRVMEAMVRDCGNGKGLTREQNSLEFYILDTLEHPTMIGLGASQLRLEAVASLGVMQPAIDAAQAAQADNSLEKMLCHQLAATHFAVMDLFKRAAQAPVMQGHDPAALTRYTNAAARLMDTYHAGMLALLKIKTGGKQNVVVQHVNVSNGGQAVVAGTVGAGPGSGTAGGGGSK